MRQIQGNLVLLRVSGDFELPEGSSYRGSTASRVILHLTQNV